MKDRLLKYFPAEVKSIGRQAEVLKLIWKHETPFPFPGGVRGRVMLGYAFSDKEEETTVPRRAARRTGAGEKGAKP